MRFTIVTSSFLISAALAGAASPELTLEIKDYAVMPITGAVDGVGNSASLLARINFLREEPGGPGKRLFVNDLNGPLYILDKSTKKVYDLSRPQRPRGKAGNLPPAGYRQPARERVHQFRVRSRLPPQWQVLHDPPRRPRAPAPAVPDNKNLPGLKLDGYSVTPAIRTFGETQREAVIVEWTDSDISNTTFEGTARELMRLQYNGRIHPMGDLIFNPTARRGDPDWRYLYVATGDGGAGRAEIRDPPQSPAARHAGGKDTPDRARSERARRHEHGQRERPLPDPERQPLRLKAGRPQGDLGLWPAQPAPIDVGRGSCRLSQPASLRTSSDFAPGRRWTSFTKARTTATRSARAPSN